ncbi:hypothetical protein S1OALGB6SA_449 [Olavius algarvensis spirochete endosymbiont]|uniref:phage virion morphogenesis protein n=1 Tax=Olavius algarvensis spirochete endosymbiont TaxID=260710 RepID=UPI000F0D60BD|nr:phage virion morphogenesis protein [Olavius algarvensis spirochete endosymbiont]VDA99381.1 hypothetical protein S1OALGB6SA_449 [Olavius algarvensis spirochete endosymbiont]
MAGYSFSVETRDFESAIGLFSKLTPRQIAELGAMAGVELIKLSREAFGSQRDPADGSAWRASASEGHRGRSTLRHTGRLMRSVKCKVEGSSVLAGSHLVYARIHQEGGSAGRGRSVKIPRRRYLGHRKEWSKRFMRTLEVRRLFT